MISDEYIVSILPI